MRLDGVVSALTATTGSGGIADTTAGVNARMVERGGGDVSGGVREYN
jgi:hypothetical protein